jgi:hypothetical protein
MLTGELQISSKPNFPEAIWEIHKRSKKPDTVWQIYSVLQQVVDPGNKSP